MKIKTVKFVQAVNCGGAASFVNSDKFNISFDERFKMLRIEEIKRGLVTLTPMSNIIFMEIEDEDVALPEEPRKAGRQKKEAPGA